MAREREYKVVDVPELLARLEIKADRRNERWWAPCPHPDHPEKEGSWFIEDCPDDKDEHGHHYCFGCKRGGYPVQLVEWVTGLEGKNAWKWLSSAQKHAPVRLQTAVKFLPNPRKFALPEEVVQSSLEEWPAEPREYAEGRGITAEEVATWRIGYALQERLAHRIVFPVYSVAGKLLSYTARTYWRNQKIRYLDPDKNDGANLGAVFGEQFWPALEQRGAVVVTEGALDGLAVLRALPGANIGGLYGSELHPGHVAKLRTFPLVVVATDSDKAGDQAYGKLSGQLLRYCEVRRFELPEGVDCAKWAVQDLAGLGAALLAVLR